MNAVEIEEAVSELAAAQFDAAEFPYAFLGAFGNKDTTIRKLRSGASNGSDIHIATCAQGTVDSTLAALRASPKTTANKAKFILATDGISLAAEDLASGEAIACDYPQFHDHFGFFLPLAGISTVKEIKNNPIDIKATGRLNKLYIELLKDNPDWATDARRPALNQFMARLIFCFFAEDTGIFLGENLFTATLHKMTDSQAGNTHEVLGELFRAMATDTRGGKRAAAGIKSWADVFPYVNGGLFDVAGDCPRFSRIARSYLLRAGELNWKEINPDIFGSMIQAVADDGERGELGMHYTSVPNILKVLNPLFLDDLREQLAAAGDNARKLRNLRKRMSVIRVFDPACGSGNFLVIAYLQMRSIEHEIVQRTRDDPKSWIKLSSFYGIEIKGFAAEIARLALLIAEFQSDVRFISQHEARAMVLPLHNTGHIVIGNALRRDWLEVCPPVSKALVEERDLAGPTGRMALEDNGFDDLGEPETFICGNPPYLGSTWQSSDQKADLAGIFQTRTQLWKSLDYVAGWFMKAADYGVFNKAAAAFVSTNSICQGQQVPILWPLVFGTGHAISFAHTSFKWTNLASDNAGVTVVVVSIAIGFQRKKQLFSQSDSADPIVQQVSNINAYLVAAPDIIVNARSTPPSGRSQIDAGGKPVEGGHLLLTRDERNQLLNESPTAARFLKRVFGASEHNQGIVRYALWIGEKDVSVAREDKNLNLRLENVRAMRAASPKPATRASANYPHETVTIIPKLTSEKRQYIPAGVEPQGTIVTDLAFAQLNAPIADVAILNSRLHFIWIATVCGKFKTDYRYSNTMGWNTFPVPPLTEQNKVELTACAEAILLAREAHFPATIADLYDPETMPDDLRRAHEANDETLERIYIGRRFKNDTERLEKLFEMYTKMTAKKAA
jgi:hypothetical protein